MIGPTLLQDEWYHLIATYGKGQALRSKILNARRPHQHRPEKLFDIRNIRTGISPQHLQPPDLHKKQQPWQPPTPSVPSSS
jgi:hypothetical protein